MTGTFAGWLIKTGVTDHGGLGRLAKEWNSNDEVAINSRRTNNHSFTQFLGERYPSHYAAWQTYCRLVNYRPLNKDT